MSTCVILQCIYEGRVVIVNEQASGGGWRVDSLRSRRGSGHVLRSASGRVMSEAVEGNGSSGEGQAHTILGWRGLTASPRLSRAPRRRHDPGVERFDGEHAIITSSQMVRKREPGYSRTTDPLGASLRKDTVFSNGKVHRLGL